MPKPKEEWDALEEALENARYDWRTLRGVSKETGLPIDRVQELIERNQKVVIRSSVPSETGEALFTTRRHYRKRASIWDRLRSGVDLKVR